MAATGACWTRARTLPARRPSAHAVSRFPKCPAAFAAAAAVDHSVLTLTCNCMRQHQRTVFQAAANAPLCVPDSLFTCNQYHARMLTLNRLLGPQAGCQPRDHHQWCGLYPQHRLHLVHYCSGWPARQPDFYLLQRWLDVNFR